MRAYTSLSNDDAFGYRRTHFSKIIFGFCCVTALKEPGYSCDSAALIGDNPTHQPVQRAVNVEDSFAVYYHSYQTAHASCVFLANCLFSLDGCREFDKLAKEGNPDAIEFPRAKIGENPYDFSFSGVKSAVLNYLNGAKMKGEEVNRADIAASFQKAVVDVLVEHTMQAAADFGMKKVAIAGGVASNGALRTAMEKACTERGYKFYRPSPIFCTDNAAMIGVAAYYEYIRGTRHSWDLNAVPNLKLGER